MEVLYVDRAIAGEKFSGHDRRLAVYHLRHRMGETLLRHCLEPKKNPGELQSLCGCGAMVGESRLEGSISLCMVCHYKMESDAKELR